MTTGQQSAAQADNAGTCVCHVCDKPCTEADFTFWRDGEIVYQCADCSQTLRRAFEQQVRFAATVYTPRR